VRFWWRDGEVMGAVYQAHLPLADVFKGLCLPCTGANVMGGHSGGSQCGRDVGLQGSRGSGGAQRLAGARVSVRAGCCQPPGLRAG